MSNNKLATAVYKEMIAMNHPLQLTGKAVLVTGGGKGIGRGITECFLRAGAEVLICGRHEPDHLPNIDGKEAHFFTCDVRDYEQIQTCIAHAVALFGQLDTLVNNAGGAPYAEAATASPRFSEAIIQLNLIAPLNFSQAANAVMQQQDEGGSIINISSVSMLRPSPGTAAYGAAKAGLVNLGASLAVEWAPKVRVNAVIVGLTKTEQSHLHYGDESGIAAVGKTIPMGRMAIPKDIGNACLFLASPLAAYISGTSIAVHGGGEKPAFLEAGNGPGPAAD
ncbi:MAG: NAD(P)-dependent dehydrogenase (short-subunit alcohol dehydrogenase family) [Alcanivorax sp.]|jgi:NAD(P)-dependent dehydrogenase (short-subunit alcohol dehydrogenase family)